MEDSMQRTSALITSAVAVLAFATMAVAAAGNPPEVDAVQAEFEFASAGEKQRICTGADGPYLEIRAHHVGSQTGDPRVSGAIDLEAHNFVSLATGLGTSEGTYTVRDPATNVLKVHGKYYGVFTDGASKFQGLVVSSLKDDAGESDHIGLFEADVNLVTGEVSGKLGDMTPDARTPAVIRRNGTCSGRWTHIGNSSG
jgi:hypothetical protein